ncbi:hypothetical protein B0F90DRAFT_997028 [Multifurca ochricompacta]|uniref:Uncharacterized protein n=1 Tax=Multifurca ochricompacta TaxID=376703 RepID=A0AAD4M1I1_9AGAM|nr:hypothetical protein B0F90DRAFT_997028 [Multifurca ochricompacta]
MAPSLPPGEARPAPKPQPIGSFPFLLLFTTATVCVLFIIWRRSDTLRTVVAHQLKDWTRQEGAVRLSEDDGPPAHSFIRDDDDDDDDDVQENDDEGGSSDRRPENTRRVSSTELQTVGVPRLGVSGLPVVVPTPTPKNRSE